MSTRDTGRPADEGPAPDFHWPLPDGAIDPCELMQGILSWESQNLAA